MENQPATPISQTPISSQNEDVSTSNIVPPSKETELKKGGTLKYIIVIVMFIVIAGGFYVAYNLWSSSEAGLPDTTGKLPQSVTGVVDVFSSEPLNTDNWFPWTMEAKTSRLEQVNGRLEIDISSTPGVYNAGGVDTRINIKGGFEATVDLAIIEGGGDDSETGLIFHDNEENWPNRLSLFLRKEGNLTNLSAVVFLDGEQRYVGGKTYNHSEPVTVKITRSDELATFSVLEEGSFVQFGQATDYYKGNGFITLHANSFEPNYPAVFSTFDNFSLTLK